MYNKLCLLTCFIVLFSIANIVAAVEPPVAFYQMGEGSGTIVGDSTGNGHNGNIVGSLVWGEGAPDFGGGLVYDGVTANYVQVDTFNPLDPATNKISGTAWIKWAGSTTWNVIAGKSGGGSMMFQWLISSSGQYGINVGGNFPAYGTTNLTAGEWAHVAFSHDGTTQFTLYINGENAGTVAQVPDQTVADGTLYIGSIENAFIGRLGFNGTIDELAFFNTSLTQADVQDVMSGALAVKGPATGPNPSKGAKDVPIDSILSWKAGPFASTHNIFFSTSFDGVNDGTALVATGQALDANTYNPGIMEYGTTYYWRVDEVNATSSSGTYTGNIWNFKTELEGYPLLPKSIINVTSFGDVYPDEPDRQDPNSTCTGLGLDANDMHSTNMKTMWLGMDEGAYLQYEFDKVYKFYDMLVWNYNEETPNNEYFGAKDVKVEYSLDGENWTEVNDVPEFNIASGDNKCIANTDVLFKGAIAKYVKLTFLTGWGDLGLYGISEVRFSAIPTYSSVPSPKTADKNIEVDAELSWKSGRDASEHKVYISTDETAIKEGTASSSTVTAASYTPSLNLGRVYYWRVDEVSGLSWTGDVWNFTTKEYNVIDNFEDYNDFTGHLVFEKWISGDIDPANGGSQMGNTDSPFAERTIINSGKQSGPFYYNVSGTAETSLVARTFDTTLDLTVDGADTLSIYYRGNAVTYAQPEPGVFALSAEGADIYGNTDEFKFVYKQLTGDGTIIARVDSIQNANAWSKAGVMIRNTLDANSVHATAVLANNNTVEFERRTEKGGTTTTTDRTNQYHPYWVKVTRSGSTFNAQLSPDGVNWRSFEADANNASTATIEMGATVYIGIVVTSHQANTLAAATFSGVQAIPGTGGKITGDWTVIAIGDTEMAEGTNTIDKMYVILEDSTGKNAKVYALANAVGSGQWMSWLIPYSQFTNVNMSKIKKITLGIGETGDSVNGKGLIYIDDIGYGHPLAK